MAEQPNDPAALAALSRLMEDKRRFGPAREYARRWVAVSPEDPAAREQLAALERRW